MLVKNFNKTNIAFFSSVFVFKNVHNISFVLVNLPSVDEMDHIVCVSM